MAAWALLALSLGGCSPALGAPSAPARPNIVLLMADDMGRADAGFTGSEIARTPHLDALAGDGLTFGRFYAAAPACSPTRGSVLTGRHPRRYGIEGSKGAELPEQEVTLAEVLSGAGYATGFFGKWHLGSLRRGEMLYSPPWKHGFDVSFASERSVPTWDPRRQPKGARRKWWPALEPGEAWEPLPPPFWRGESDPFQGALRGCTSELVMNEALGFVREQAEAEAPFLAVVWFHAPHEPIVSGPPFTDAFEELGDEGPDKYYYGALAAMDAQVGRLRKELDDLGLAEKTLVWFLSDNGPAGRGRQSRGETGGLRGRKSTLHEGGLRVPSAVAWPGVIQPGSKEPRPAITSDLFPTLLDAAGLEPPDDRPLDGVSLLGRLRGGPPPPPRALAFSFIGTQALVEERYKLVHVPESVSTQYFDTPLSDPGTFLYDLSKDPGETEDLAKEHPEEVARLTELLERWERSRAASARGADYGKSTKAGR